MVVHYNSNLIYILYAINNKFFFNTPLSYSYDLNFFHSIEKAFLDILAILEVQELECQGHEE